MRKPLVYGSLWWLKKQMPPALRVRLDEELERFDANQSKDRKKGETRDSSAVRHMRYMTEHYPHLREMRFFLKDILVKYIPLTEEHLRTNVPPKLSDCSYFWGRELARIEKESTKTLIPA